MNNKYKITITEGFKIINFYGDNWKFKEVGINTDDKNAEDIKKVIEDNKIDKIIKEC